jgi:hypothetical protein
MTFISKETDFIEAVENFFLKKLYNRKKFNSLSMF